MKTTFEEAKERVHNEEVKLLQGLLEKNYDAENGFKKALEHTENLDLKEYLKYQAAIRNRFATELDYIIRSLDETPVESGSSTGSLHRTWIDVKAKISGKTDDAILEECIRGDKASVKEYKDAFEEFSFPPEIQRALSKQLEEVEVTLETIKTIEDLKDKEW
ncbi:PA2169 family four-helix-bundle protein [Zhouia sp. PK063]|uniref:PA2169 family four-helix-bundle protein n=1 Tax=Zhouia sp. PK063 TaxID=3373602 RepID=UPI0037B522B7